jgi:hypothetical protein
VRKRVNRVTDIIHRDSQKDARTKKEKPAMIPLASFSALVPD